MVNLDELFQLDGVVAIAKVDDMGRITDWKAKGVVDPEITKHASKLLVEVEALFMNFAREAPRNWSPRRALIYNGGEMTLITAGGAVVTVENKKVNFEKLFKVFGILGF
jgi:roadblock/LC7 domain-containing protein